MISERHWMLWHAMTCHDMTWLHRNLSAIRWVVPCCSSFHSSWWNQNMKPNSGHPDSKKSCNRPIGPRSGLSQGLETPRRVAPFGAQWWKWWNYNGAGNKLPWLMMDYDGFGMFGVGLLQYNMDQYVTSICTDPYRSTMIYTYLHGVCHWALLPVQRQMNLMKFSMKSQVLADGLLRMLEFKWIQYIPYHSSHIAPTLRSEKIWIALAAPRGGFDPGFEHTKQWCKHVKTTMWTVPPTWHQMWAWQDVVVPMRLQARNLVLACSCCEDRNRILKKFQLQSCSSPRLGGI